MFRITTAVLHRTRPWLSRAAVPRLSLLPVLPGNRAADSGRHSRAYSRYEAFDSGFDPDELKAARQWRQSFSQEHVPKGDTTYSRSSGPGGQHVNKTESKATTVWPVGELMGVVPSMLRSKLRDSRFYTSASDSLTIQAQEQRSRTANAEANRQKLYEELMGLYDATVPGESRPETARKYKQVEKSFHEARIKAKKKQSSKKQFRKGGGFDD